MNEELPRYDQMRSEPLPFQPPAFVVSVGKVLTWVFLLLGLLAIALEVGAWKQQEQFAGPFTKETPGTLAYAIAIPAPRYIHCCLAARGDDNHHPFRSDLQLWINGQAMGAPHSLHADIRNGKIGGFSHWDGYLIFSLPLGVENTSATHVVVRYTLQPRRGLAFFLPLLGVALAYLFYRPLLMSFWRTYGSRCVAVPALVLRALGYLGLAASLLFLASSAFALARGWALPTTAIIFWSRSARWAAAHDYLVSSVLIMLAALGTVAGWAASVIGADTGAMLREEARCERFFRCWGAVILACLLCFSISSMWSGIVRPGDLESSSIGGLIAFSDAGGYVAGAYDQAKDGIFHSFDLRRPLAAAFRDLLLFLGGSSVPAMLLLQACVLAAAMWFAASAVARWRGLWAAAAFLALTYIYVRTFAATALTESLGLTWAFVSIPFLIAALRSGSISAALLAFAATTLALLTRMGSMFSIPAMLLWIVCCFGANLKEKTKIGFAAVVILLGVSSVCVLIQTTYGEGRSHSTNFAYTLCGLTIGTTWDGCPTKFADQMRQVPQDEDHITNLMYALAWKSFKADPRIFFRRLSTNSVNFISETLGVLWQGYDQATPSPKWLPEAFITLLSAIGILYLLVTFRARDEWVLWLLLGGSIVASSAVVYADDGQRALAASYPLISLFFAAGMVTPISMAAARKTPDLQLGRVGVIVIAGALVGFLFVPLLAHRLSPIESIAGGHLDAKPNEAVVFGGRRMTGFLVVGDSAPLRHDIPSLHLSDFKNIVQASNVEVYQGLLNPTVPPVPFGFIFSPRLESDAASEHQFIVPAKVMTQQGVAAWRFYLQRWSVKAPLMSGYGSTYWFYVTQAMPLQ